MDKSRVGVGTACLVFDDQDRFMLLKRKSKHGLGTYGLVGGWMEFAESFEDVVKRETLEEIGCKVDRIELVTVGNVIFEKEGVHNVGLFFIMRLKKGEIPKNNEPEKCEKLLVLPFEGWAKIPQPSFVNYAEYYPEEKVYEYIERTKNDR